MFRYVKVLFDNMSKLGIVTDVSEYYPFISGVHKDSMGEAEDQLNAEQRQEMKGLCCSK